MTEKVAAPLCVREGVEKDTCGRTAGGTNTLATKIHHTAAITTIATTTATTARRATGSRSPGGGALGGGIPAGGDGPGGGGAGAAGGAGLGEPWGRGCPWPSHPSRELKSLRGLTAWTRTRSPRARCPRRTM